MTVSKLYFVKKGNHIQHIMLLKDFGHDHGYYRKRTFFQVSLNVPLRKQSKESENQIDFICFVDFSAC